MAIYEITADQIRKIPETTYSLAGLRVRRVGIESSADRFSEEVVLRGPSKMKPGP